jgi:hypothetical protein
MDDDGLGSVDVTGRWVGFDRYRSEQMGTYPLTADLRQDGDRIAGEMYDQFTERSEFLDKLLDASREDMSPWNRWRLEEAIRQFGPETVVVKSRLPDTSDLEGRVAGDRVEFTKTYRGSLEVHWAVDGEEIGSGQVRGHKVFYSGHLDREGGSIAGEWIIRRRGLLGRFLPPSGRGTFELYKKV